jgi:hypothetical protein
MQNSSCSKAQKRLLEMNTQSIDTHKKSEHLLISLLREKTAAKKFALIRSLSQSTIQLSKKAIARANKNMDDDQVNVILIDLHYGRELAQRFQRFIGEKRDNS